MRYNQTPGARLRAVRERLGLTLDQFAKALEMGIGGAQELYDMEAERRPVPGPVALAAAALGDGWRPAHLRTGPRLAIAA